jgi:hypothetical protein
MPAVKEMVLKMSLDRRLPFSENPRERLAMFIRTNSSIITKM